MIELRNFHTKRRYFDTFTGESYMRLVLVLQYRQTWTSDMDGQTGVYQWIDVPYVMDKEADQ